MLQVINIRKTYGRLKALDDITFQVKSGTELTIMGPSGSGKTTLVNLIAGLDSPDSGHIQVNGMDITGLSGEELAEYRRENVGIIFQQFHLIDYLTALENVMLAQYFHSMPDRRDAMEALDRVGLRDRAHHLPSQLSGGEQQRVAVARAITNDPELILADEPTGNLDAENEQIILDIFRKFK
ncbi:MAG: ABC transporter ATP-binding protein, partial [Calditrichota bacterium]